MASARSRWGGKGVEAELVAAERTLLRAFQRPVEALQDLAEHRIAGGVVDGGVELVVDLAPGAAGIDLDQQDVAEA